MLLRTVAVFTFALLLNSLRAEEKPAAASALGSAMQKLAASDDDWAYTQVFRRTDCTTGDTVARFDPSKPVGSQWQLLKLRGRTPTEAEAAKWCKRRDQDVNQTDSRALVELLDLEHARILSQDTEREHATFEIPLKKNTIAHIPAENFVAYADVDCGQAALEKLSIVLRQTVRLIGGVAQIQSAKGEMVFKNVGEGTRPAYIMASGSGQALFRKLNRSAEIIFTDQRRVKS